MYTLLTIYTAYIILTYILSLYNPNCSDFEDTGLPAADGADHCPAPGPLSAHHSTIHSAHGGHISHTA